MRRWLIFVPVIVLTVGCGRHKLVPVSGRVTLNNNPLANAYVSFQPTGSGEREPGPGSYGTTDGDGRFTLQLVGKDQPGAWVGHHRVVISLKDPPNPNEVSDSASRDRTEKLPLRYNRDSKLTFDVPAGGSDAANFDLTDP